MFQESIKSMLEGIDSRGWVPEIVKTIASQSENVDRLFKNILKHKTFLHNNKLSKVKYNLRFENHVKSIISNNFVDRFWSNTKCSNLLAKEVKKSNAKRLSPNDFADKLEKVFCIEE